MNPELILLTKVIEEGNFRALQDNDVGLGHFTTEEGRGVYQFLSQTYNHKHTYGSIPSMELVCHHVRTFEPTRSDDSIRELVDYIRGDFVRGQLLHLSAEIRDLAEQRLIDRAVERIVTRANELVRSRAGSKDFNLAASVDAIEERYELVKNVDGVIGIPTPWDPLTKETLGLQSGQFIVLYGRPGAMKCVCEGERIMARDGRLTPIEDHPEHTFVPSFTEATGKMRWAHARRVYSGVKECVEVTVAPGQKLRTSDEHLYMVPGGYERICDLSLGDPIGMAQDTLATATGTPTEMLKSGRFWGTITEIRRIGKVACYDIIIEDGQDPNFVVEGFIVHNTWMGICFAVHAYLCNRRVLFYTREMTEIEILMRIAGRIAEVDFDAFRKGRLQPALERQVFDILRGLSSDEEVLAGEYGFRKNLVITTARDLKTGNTVDGIRRKVEEHGSDIVIADGIYRMGDIRTGQKSVKWQNMYHISQDLKDAAKDLEIPIIGITQANKVNDLAYADAFLQDADMALLIALNKKKQEVTHIIPKLREGNIGAYTINAFPASNFEMKREEDEETAMRLKEKEEQHKYKGGKDGKGSSDGTKSSGRRVKRVFRH